MYIPLKIYTLHWKHVRSMYSRYVCYGAEKTAVGVWGAPEGAGRGVQSGSAGPTDLSSGQPLDSGASHGCCDLQAALRELPLVMKSDCLIHGKQKCRQSSRTGHQRQQRLQPRDSSAQKPGPRHTGGGGPLMWYWWWKDAWLLQYSC